MRARGFIQHSVAGGDGDMEGTPVAILEAAASGLPVIATRHAGIPEAVLDGQSGWLVDEHDADAFAERMLAICQNPELAVRAGSVGRDHMRTHYRLEDRIGQLADILRQAAATRN